MSSSIDLKALSIFIRSPVSSEMMHKLVVATLQVLPCQESKNNGQDVLGANGKPLPSLMTFVTRLVRYTNVYSGTLMACLVYLNRLSARLPKNAQGIPCTRHRILLSCLILSAKYHNDSSPKNIHWAKYTDGLFSVKDINLMERQLLYLLNWDLKVTNEEMIEALDSFLEPIKQDLVNYSKVKKYVQRQRLQKEAHKQELQRQQALHIPANNSYHSPLSSSSSSSSPSDWSPTRRYSSRSPYSMVSRSSSNSSIGLRHRQPSNSSISSISSEESYIHKPAPFHDRIDPIIELTARKEEIELNRMLRSLNSRPIEN